MLKVQGSLLLSMVLLASGCATKIDGLMVSDSFKANELKKEALITGGVVDVKGPLNRSDSNLYSGLMLNEIKDERKFVNLRPVETLIQGLGDKSYDETLATYKKSGLDPETLKRLAAKLPGTRFVALAKIESNLLEKGESHQRASESKDEKGKVTKIPESVTKTHKRTILVSMHIYDLMKQEVAFSGQVSKFREASRNYTVNAIGNVLSVVNAIQGKDDESTYPTPEAPSINQVLGDVFEGFAENFPKE